MHKRKQGAEKPADFVLNTDLEQNYREELINMIDNFLDNYLNDPEYLGDIECELEPPDGDAVLEGLRNILSYLVKVLNKVIDEESIQSFSFLGLKHEINESLNELKNAFNAGSITTKNISFDFACNVLGSIEKIKKYIGEHKAHEGSAESSKATFSGAEAGSQHIKKRKYTDKELSEQSTSSVKMGDLLGHKVALSITERRLSQKTGNLSVTDILPGYVQENEEKLISIIGEFLNSSSHSRVLLNSIDSEPRSLYGDAVLESFKNILSDLTKLSHKVRHKASNRFAYEEYSELSTSNELQLAVMSKFKELRSCVRSGIITAKDVDINFAYNITNSIQKIQEYGEYRDNKVRKSKSTSSEAKASGYKAGPRYSKKRKHTGEASSTISSYVSQGLIHKEQISGATPHTQSLLGSNQEGTYALPVQHGHATPAQTKRLNNRNSIQSIKCSVRYLIGNLVNLKQPSGITEQEKGSFCAPDGTRLSDDLKKIMTGLLDMAIKKFDETLFSKINFAPYEYTYRELLDPETVSSLPFEEVSHVITCLHRDLLQETLKGGDLIAEDFDEDLIFAIRRANNSFGSLKKAKAKAKKHHYKSGLLAGSTSEQQLSEPSGGSDVSQGLIHKEQISGAIPHTQSLVGSNQEGTSALPAQHGHSTRAQTKRLNIDLGLVNLHKEKRNFIRSIKNSIRSFIGNLVDLKQLSSITGPEKEFFSGPDGARLLDDLRGVLIGLFPVLTKRFGESRVLSVGFESFQPPLSALPDQKTVSSFSFQEVNTVIVDLHYGLLKKPLEEGKFSFEDFGEDLISAIECANNALDSVKKAEDQSKSMSSKASDFNLSTKSQFVKKAKTKAKEHHDESGLLVSSISGQQLSGPSGSSDVSQGLVHKAPIYSAKRPKKHLVGVSALTVEQSDVAQTQIQEAIAVMGHTSAKRIKPNIQTVVQNLEPLEPQRTALPSGSAPRGEQDHLESISRLLGDLTSSEFTSNVSALKSCRGPDGTYLLDDLRRILTGLFPVLTKRFGETRVFFFGFESFQPKLSALPDQKTVSSFSLSEVHNVIINLYYGLLKKPLEEGKFSFEDFGEDLISAIEHANNTLGSLDIDSIKKAEVQIRGPSSDVLNRLAPKASDSSTTPFSKSAGGASSGVLRTLLAPKAAASSAIPFSKSAGGASSDVLHRLARKVTASSATQSKQHLVSSQQGGFALPSLKSIRRLLDNFTNSDFISDVSDQEKESCRCPDGTYLLDDLRRILTGLFPVLTKRFGESRVLSVGFESFQPKLSALPDQKTVSLFSFLEIQCAITHLYYGLLKDPLQENAFSFEDFGEDLLFAFEHANNAIDSIKKAKVQIGQGHSSDVLHISTPKVAASSATTHPKQHLVESHQDGSALTVEQSDVTQTQSQEFIVIVEHTSAEGIKSYIPTVARNLDPLELHRTALSSTSASTSGQQRFEASVSSEVNKPSGSHAGVHTSPSRSSLGATETPCYNLGAQNPETTTTKDASSTGQSLQPSTPQPLLSPQAYVAPPVYHPHGESEIIFYQQNLEREDLRDEISSLLEDISSIESQDKTPSSPGKGK